jgi:5'(3')-deoxyribonucleotidase
MKEEGEKDMRVRSRIEPVIYLDMDGVCTDFTSASIRANGHIPSEVLGRWERDFSGSYHVHQMLSIDREAYWQAIARQGEVFWSDLEEYPWFSQLYGSLREIAPVIFLSASTRSPWCLSGKLKWLQQRFGVAYRDFIFTPHKQQLAHPSAMLIDDLDVNVESFSQAGGTALLFPQIWNSNHQVEDDKVMYTLTQVGEWHTRVTSEPLREY